ncbi:MAG: methylenetetrahydrofolate reductase [NAD(P)H] [Bacillota bacterium]
MRIKDFYKAKKPVVSLEIFPPKTEDRIDIVSRLTSQFKELAPAFISVTYGAGGTTRDTTIEIATFVSRLGFEVMAHLTCVGHTAGEIDDILARLHAGGVTNILALRGDPPKGVQNYDYSKDDFRFAVDLIRHIRVKGVFGIGAAAYPEGHVASPRISIDWAYLKEKVNAGAEFLVTQLFFDNRVFYHFLESVRKIGITCPISAGILPVLNAGALERMVSLCGASIPAELWVMLEKYENDQEGLEKAGIEYATAQVQDLVENGVDGVHLYTLNRSDWVTEVLRNVDLDRWEPPETWELWQPYPREDLPHHASEDYHRGRQ